MKTKLFGFLPEARREGIITKEVEGELLVYDRTRDEAASLAKKVVSDADVRRTWTLYGDPAMRVR